jgi:hypothetical protein
MAKYDAQKVTARKLQDIQNMNTNPTLDNQTSNLTSDRSQFLRNNNIHSEISGL